MTVYINGVRKAVGFLSKARAFRETSDQVIPNAGAAVVVQLNAESWDGLGEFDSSVKSGAADATQASKLHDADGGFTAADVGAWIWNTTDNTYTTVTGFVDSGELDLADDIMVNGENYELYHSRFVAKEAGTYSVCGAYNLQDLADGKKYVIGFLVNGAGVTQVVLTSGAVQWVSALASDKIYLGIGDYIQMTAAHEHGANRNLKTGASLSFMAIHRLS